MPVAQGGVMSVRMPPGLVPVPVGMRFGEGPVVATLVVLVLPTAAQVRAPIRQVPQQFQ
jgi:hypothetical protein